MSEKAQPPITRNFVLILLNALLCAAAFSISGLSMTAGPYLSLYVSELSGSDWIRSLVPVLWSAPALTSLLMSYVSERLKREKALVTGSLAALWVIAAAAGILPAFMPSAPGLAVTVLIIGIFLGNVLANLYFFTLFAWFPALLGEGSMGKLQGARLVAFWGVNALVMALAGKWLDAHPGLKGYAELYAMAGAFGLLGAVPLLFLRGVPVEQPPHEPFLKGTGQLFRDREFRLFLALVFAINVSPMLTGAYGNIFLRDQLKMSYAQFGFVNMLPSLAALVMVLGWGRLADSLGSRIAVFIGVAGYIVYPALMAACCLGHIGPIYPAYLISGGLCSAYNVGWVPLMYSLSPKHKRATAMAMVWVACAIAGVIVPFLGGALVNKLGDFTFSLGDRAFGAVNVLLMVQAALALTAIPLACALRLPGHASAWDALSLFAQNPLRALWLAFLGDHIVGLLRKGWDKFNRPD